MNLKRIYRRFIDADISTLASALAYHTLLGIVPAVGILFWYLKSIGITDRYVLLIRGYIVSQLNIDSSEVFETYFDKFTYSVAGNSWGWIGLILFIYTIWNLIGRFGRSLDLILTSQSKEKPATIERRLWINFRRLFTMLALPMALILSMLVTQWIKKDSILHHFFNIKTFGAYFALPLAWVASIVATFMVYYFVPRVKVRWKEALRAAVFVGPLSEVVRFLFGVYNSYAVSVHKIYGVLAVVPLFILWVQISWTLLLTGALFIRLPSISYKKEIV